jgi:hypothetical protein
VPRKRARLLPKGWILRQHFEGEIPGIGLPLAQQSDLRRTAPNADRITDPTDEGPLMDASCQSIR